MLQRTCAAAVVRGEQRDADHERALLELWALLEAQVVAAQLDRLAASEVDALAQATRAEASARRGETAL